MTELSGYISKQELYDTVDGGYDVDFSELPETKAAILESIEHFWTADVRENVHGHWDTVKIKKGEWWHSCSECKATWGSDDGELDFKFCPNCGACMWVVKDES